MIVLSNNGINDTPATFPSKDVQNFKTESERKYLVIYTERILSICKEHSIQNVMLLDRSARAMGFALKYFKRRHNLKHDIHPYFINPNYPLTQQHQPVTSLNIGSLLAKPGLRMHNGIFLVSNSDIENDEKILFDETYPQLKHQKNSPILIVDTCSHTGETMSVTKKYLEDVGFEKIYTCIADKPDNNHEIDFVISDDQSKETCYPFGHGAGVIKTKGSLISAPSSNDFNKRQLRILRKDIKVIIDERNIKGNLKPNEEQ